MANTCLIALGVILAFLGYVSFAPVSNFDPQVNLPNIYIAYDDHIVDTTFARNMKVIQHPGMNYPEDIDVNPQTGEIYTGLKNGQLVIVDESGYRVVGTGKGMILGLKLSEDKQSLYFVDLKAGMCRLNLTSREVQVLTSGYQGTPFKFLDNFDIAADGKIYMTDASLKYEQHEFFMDIFEGKPFGRVYVYDPQTKATELLLDNLYFPNGVQVSPDQQAIYFSETTAYRISKYHLKGDKAGTYEIVLEGLPGSPDNIKFNSKGQLWVAVPSFRDGMTDKLLRILAVKRILARLPRWVHDEIANSSEMGAMKIDVNSRRLLKILRSKEVNKHKMITTVLEKDGRLYFGSLTQNKIGILELSDIKQQPAQTSQEL